MFQKLANAVADRVIIKLAQMDRALRQQQYMNKIAMSDAMLEKKKLYDQNKKMKYLSQIHGMGYENTDALVDSLLKTNADEGLIAGVRDLGKANASNKLLKNILGGTTAASLAGNVGLGIANANKAKQIAKLKQLGLLGGAAAGLGGLGLGYLMGNDD